MNYEKTYGIERMHSNKEAAPIPQGDVAKNVDDSGELFSKESYYVLNLNV